MAGRSCGSIGRDALRFRDGAVPKNYASRSVIVRSMNSFFNLLDDVLYDLEVQNLPIHNVLGTELLPGAK
jgi:hypothetical protein